MRKFGLAVVTVMISLSSVMATASDSFKTCKVDREASINPSDYSTYYLSIGRGLISGKVKAIKIQYAIDTNAIHAIFQADEKLPVGEDLLMYKHVSLFGHSFQSLLIPKSALQKNSGPFQIQAITGGPEFFTESSNWTATCH